MDITRKSRTDLKAYFVKNAIPTELNYSDLIDGALNHKDDGVTKTASTPLCVQAVSTGERPTIHLYDSFAATAPQFVVSLLPGTTTGGVTKGKGFALGTGDGAANARLFVDKDTGNIGLGTIDPAGFKVNVDGTLNVTGAASLASLATTGKATVGGTLGVTGATTLAALSASNTSVTGTLGVSGATTLAALSASNTSVTGTLGVSGATTLAALSASNTSVTGTLGVSGATTLAALSASNTSVTGTLGVSGATTLAALSASNTSVTGTLGVSGATTLAALSASNTSVTGTLGVSGATNLSSLSASGNTSIGGTLGVSGATSLSSLSASGNTSVGGTLGVTGATSLSSLSASGNTSVGGTLGVTGATSLSSLSASGNASVTGTLGVTGATSLSSLSASGNASITGTLGVTGATSLSSLSASGNASITGTLGVTGATSLSSLSASGNASVTGTLGVTGVLSTNSTGRLGPVGTTTNNITSAVVLNGGYITTPAWSDDFSNGFSIEAWIYYTASLTDGGQTFARIIDFSNGSSADNIVFCNSGDTTALRLQVWSGANVVFTVDATNALSTGTWMHLCGTIEGSTCRLYKNGQALTTTITGSVGVPASIGRSTCCIGKSPWTTDDNLKAKLAQVRLWGRALSAAEVLHHYNYQRPLNETQLYAAWAMDEGSGTTVTERLQNSRNGTITGTYSWDNYLPSGLSWDSSNNVTIGNDLVVNGPVRTGNFRATINRSTAISTASTTFVNMPDMMISGYITTGTILVIVNLPAVGMDTSNTRATFQITVDGTSYALTHNEWSGGWLRRDVAMNALVGGLSVGYHTVRVQWMRDPSAGTTGIVYCGMVANSLGATRSMTVIEI
ncbi:MAG: LamG-like jellyroll fold domain-containing protein [Polyangia bacterium]